MFFLCHLIGYVLCDFPDETEEKDEMKKLEERARALAAEAEGDTLKPSRIVPFVRYRFFRLIFILINM